MKMILAKKTFKSLLILFMGLFFLETTVYAAQDSLELHSGTVKLIRGGKSLILKNAGETYDLHVNDRLQTGKETQITLYLKNKDNTVKLFSNSFFKLDDLAAEENSMALLTGKGNFSVKPIPQASATESAESANSENGQDTKNKLKTKLGGILKGSLAQLGKRKLRRKKKRFNVRTVSAIVGVRGTDFVIATSGDSTNLLGLSGEVTLASPEVPDYEIPVLANEISHVKEGSGPSVPVTVSPDERDKIAKSDGANSFQEVQFGQSELVGTLQSRLKRDDETQQFEEEVDREGELLDQLDRLDELETLLENAENAIDAAKIKTLMLSMTFTNR
ncbi:MAG: FecR domain-containing protein [SAR324 cluster bacterium]|nr:FecR domain-containing protein [SAR324 cluster bacterium]